MGVKVMLKAFFNAISHINLAFCMRPQKKVGIEQNNSELKYSEKIRKK